MTKHLEVDCGELAYPVAFGKERAIHRARIGNKRTARAEVRLGTEARAGNCRIRHLSLQIVSEMIPFRGYLYLFVEFFASVSKLNHARPGRFFRVTVASGDRPPSYGVFSAFRA